MNTTKTYADLLREVFESYVNDRHDVYPIHNNIFHPTKAVKVPITGYAEEQFPALILRQEKNDPHHVHLYISSVAPQVGRNGRIIGDLFGAHSKRKNKKRKLFNKLWFKQYRINDRLLYRLTSEVRLKIKHLRNQEFKN